LSPSQCLSLSPFTETGSPSLGRVLKGSPLRKSLSPFLVSPSVEDTRLSTLKKPVETVGLVEEVGEKELQKKKKEGGDGVLGHDLCVVAKACIDRNRKKLLDSSSCSTPVDSKNPMARLEASPQELTPLRGLYEVPI